VGVNNMEKRIISVEGLASSGDLSILVGSEFSGIESPMEIPQEDFEDLFGVAPANGMVLHVVVDDVTEQRRSRLNIIRRRVALQNE